MCAANLNTNATSMKDISVLDTVGTVYHLVIYMQSNKIYNVVLMSKF